MDGDTALERILQGPCKVTFPMFANAPATARKRSILHHRNVRQQRPDFSETAIGPGCLQSRKHVSSGRPARFLADGVGRATFEPFPRQPGFGLRFRLFEHHGETRRVIATKNRRGNTPALVAIDASVGHKKCSRDVPRQSFAFGHIRIWFRSRRPRRIRPDATYRQCHPVKTSRRPIVALNTLIKLH